MIQSKVTLNILFTVIAALLFVSCTAVAAPAPAQPTADAQSAAPQATAATSSTPAPPTPAAGATPSTVAPAGPGSGPGGYGPGMMGRGPGGPGYGPGGAPGYGPGMMGSGYGPSGTPYNQNGSPVTMDQAVQIANQYLASTGYPDLQTSDVHEYTNGFEAEYTEKSTGAHAFQVLIDKYTGAVFPEMGPNMMWNTKYSPMGSMMGSPTVQATTSMPVSAQTARANAQQWLSSNLQGMSLGPDVDTAYGYYEFDVLQNGKAYGEIDVNGYTGQVWYENWHGPLVQEREPGTGGQ